VTDANIRRATELYQQGHSLREVAAMLGVHKTTVGKVIRGAGLSRPAGITHRARERAVPADKRAYAIWAYWVDGTDAQSVANRLGTNEATVMRWIDDSRHHPVARNGAPQDCERCRALFECQGSIDRLGGFLRADCEAKWRG
jgi:transposase